MSCAFNFFFFLSLFSVVHTLYTFITADRLIVHTILFSGQKDPCNLSLPHYPCRKWIRLCCWYIVYVLERWTLDGLCHGPSRLFFLFVHTIYWLLTRSSRNIFGHLNRLRTEPQFTDCGFDLMVFSFFICGPYDRKRLSVVTVSSRFLSRPEQSNQTLGRLV